MTTRTPLRELMARAAMGNEPPPDAIDALGLASPETRQAVLTAALIAVELHDQGNHGAARKVAHSTWELYDRELPDAPSPASQYAHVTDPDALAQLIRQGGSTGPDTSPHPSNRQE